MAQYYGHIYHDNLDPPDEYFWGDDFKPTKEMVDKARDMFQDFKEEVACVCNLDDRNWESEDYDYLLECLGI